MKANELMIGDWVLFSGKPKRVESIFVSDNGVEQIYVFGNTSQVSTINAYIQPIPLTLEILEKNGFDVSDGEVMRYNFEEDGQSFHFGLRQMYDKENKPKGYSFYAFNVLTIIDFVHELQHALRLCGIDKNIEL